MSNRVCRNCTGCGACACVCPKQCITMKENTISELRPFIDSKQCIGCDLCRKICPQNHPCDLAFPIACYAAWSRNEKDWIHSASGGVAAVFARYQAEQGQGMYGCDYDEHGDLVHFPLQSQEDIARLQSSKYSQSSAFVAFKQIKEDLQQGRQVVFVGTPCQVAGLKRFLRKDFENLVTVDLVCHGTPPNAYFKEYINNLGLGDHFQKIRFRGEHDQKLTLWKDQEIVYQKHYTEDLYFSSFYKNKISMDSCYHCQYAQGERVSDITLADFWGLGELQTIERKSDRPSLILTNTPRGEAFFQLMKDRLWYEERTVQEAIDGNGRLNRSPGKSLEAKAFRAIYRVASFETAARWSVKAGDLAVAYHGLEKKLQTFSKRVKKAVLRRVKRKR